MNKRIIFFVALLVAIVPMFAVARELMLGNVEFLNSGSKEAQADFKKGILYLHSFEYDSAKAAFRRAESIDPDFAMAYWGEAMTNHHSLWKVQHLAAAQDVLKRFGETSDKRAAKIPTQREKDFVHAAEVLFAMTDETKNLGKLERDIHYRDAMKRVHETYPNDLEARIFYGLSVLGVGSAKREYATYMKAAAIITPVWDANRQHPGAAHYLIHSYDDPVHAILGLPMAQAYGKIAVDAAHAQHMTSHIYVALGMWDNMIAANVTALRVESAKASGEGSRSREAWHHRYWLHYGRLQEGDLDSAKDLLTWARDRISNNPLPREPAYYGAMFARWLIDTEAWGDADDWLAPSGVDIPVPHYNFARAYAAAKLGNVEKSRRLLAKISVGNLGNPEIILSNIEIDILKLQVNSAISMTEGNTEQALAQAREAVQVQASLPFRYGPPRISKPTAEMLGDLLFELDKFGESILAYEDQLTRSQLRTNSLLGLARASAKHGDLVKSKKAYGFLEKIHDNASVDY